MEKDELLELLKDNLKVETYVHHRLATYSGGAFYDVAISLVFDGEEVSSSEFTIEATT